MAALPLELSRLDQTGNIDSENRVTFHQGTRDAIGNAQQLNKIIQGMTS